MTTYRKIMPFLMGIHCLSTVQAAELIPTETNIFASLKKEEKGKEKESMTLESFIETPMKDFLSLATQSDDTVSSSESEVSVALNFQAYQDSSLKYSPLPFWTTELLTQTQRDKLETKGQANFEKTNKTFHKNLALIKDGKASKIKIVLPNKYSDDFSTALHRIINSPCTKQLSLEHSNLDSTSCLVIRDALRSNTTLEVLIFDKTLTDYNLHNFEMIMNGLKANKTLKTLHFTRTSCLKYGSSNCGVIAPVSPTAQEPKPKMGAYGALMDMLRVNTGIETLILDNTTNGQREIEAELEALADALAVNTTIKTIHISRNYIYNSTYMWKFMTITSKNSTWLPTKIIENGVEKELEHDMEFRSFSGASMIINRHYKEAPCETPTQPEKPTKSKKFGWTKKSHRQDTSISTTPKPLLVSELTFIMPDKK